MAVIILARNGRWHIFFPARLVHPPIDDNHIELVVVLQDLNLLERVPVDQDAVRVVARLDLAKLVGAHEEFGDAGSCGDDGFVGGEAEELGKVLEVACVGTMGCPGEAIVTALSIISRH